MEQFFVFGVLGAALVLFITNWLRYDLVALLALLAVTLVGIVPAEDAFLGFGHPAVITVAAVLVLSRGLLNAGVVDFIARLMSRAGENPTAQVGAMGGTVMVSSAFMNNIGALALMLPVAIRMARRAKRSPSFLLMPLAFASLLGGLITLIGTPPNIIIATFRGQVTDGPFRMFDFTPVGLGVALAGMAFIVLIGWRLTPQRKGSADRESLFRIKEYTSEVRVPAASPLVGSLVRDLRNIIEDDDVLVAALIRGDRRVSAPSSYEFIRADDVLVLEAAPNDLTELVDVAGLELIADEDIGEEMLGSSDVSVIEAVVTSDSPIIGMTARSLNMRWRYGVNLLAVARKGERLIQRLPRIRFRANDILLLQGRTETLYDSLPNLGCLPLAERDLRIGKPRRLLLASGIFGGALLASALGGVPVQVSFMCGVVVMLLLRVLSLKEAYASIDWPIIVLLGALLPVGGALETTGGAQLIADNMLLMGVQLPPVATLGILLVGTTLLSNVINNAAAAVLMAPIALNIANGLGITSDPFFMSVAIGASSAFLTPIGHQSNTLVMGPGGYRFGDYWPMGLPLQIIVVAVAVPLIAFFWPLTPL